MTLTERERLEVELQPVGLAYYDWILDRDVRTWHGPLQTLMVALMLRYRNHGDPANFMRDLAAYVEYQLDGLNDEIED